ncbi:MAG TPA: hypothetical protein VMW90_06885 [Acidobacteriota bacterium]|nr:hypothetical protein [Acidobacteriota bacterium]
MSREISRGMRCGLNREISRRVRLGVVFFALDADDPMSNDLPSHDIKENVSPFDIDWRNGCYCDGLPFLYCGMHTPARCLKSHTLPATQKLSAHVNK